MAVSSVREGGVHLLLELLQGLLDEVSHGSDIAPALVPGGNDSVRKLLQLWIVLETLQATAKVCNMQKHANKCKGCVNATLCLPPHKPFSLRLTKLVQVIVNLCPIWAVGLGSTQ